MAIGNPDRGDDGFGAAVAARLRAQAPANVCIVECRGDVLALLERWSGYKIVIVVDAAARDREPGRVRRFDLANDTLPAM
ncbi:MAG TPA: hydrogenase maturation protease, partial [Stellaceae bacterium]|nr:hydrogenase maturation protease [Stellaceae bacterium]